MLQEATMQFLEKLQQNNTKEWFDHHRTSYNAAKKDFDNLVATIITMLPSIDPSIGPLQTKDCTFRLNRDVRFSKNKEPYKPYMGAFFAIGGKSSPLAGYYLHIEPHAKNFVGGGIYMPDSGATKKIRQEIDYCFEEFQSILTNTRFVNQFKQLSEEKGMKLIREPKGYEKNNPAITFLKFKSWVVKAPLETAQIRNKSGVKKIKEAFETLQPLVQFINRPLLSS